MKKVLKFTFTLMIAACLYTGPAKAYDIGIPDDTIQQNKTALYELRENLHFGRDDNWSLELNAMDSTDQAFRDAYADNPSGALDKDVADMSFGFSFRYRFE
jgi:hypothetical protein